MLHDGAIYCRAEGRIVPRGLPADAAPARGHHQRPERHPPDRVAEAHWRSAGEKLSRSALQHGPARFVMAALVAAVAGFVVVVLV